MKKTLIVAILLCVGTLFSCSGKNAPNQGNGDESVLDNSSNIDLSGEKTNLETVGGKDSESEIVALRTDALESADKLVEDENIVGAIATIENAISIIGEDVELEQKLTMYQSAYARDIGTQVDTLTSDRKYSDAIALIEEALKIVPGNVELTDKLNSVTAMQPILLSSVNPFNGGFEWNNAGIPQDPFGNTYTDYTVICYDENLIQNGHQPGYMVKRFDKFYSEYYTAGSYNLLTMQVSPYIYTGENSNAYIEVYTDDVLVYTSPTITRKTQPFICEVDIKGAQYVKIIANVYTGSGGTTTAIILSEMKIWP